MSVKSSPMEKLREQYSKQLVDFREWKNDRVYGLAKMQLFLWMDRPCPALAFVLYEEVSDWNSNLPPPFANHEVEELLGDLRSLLHVR